jgi:hypothetical protein
MWRILLRTAEVLGYNFSLGAKVASVIPQLAAPRPLDRGQLNNEEQTGRFKTVNKSKTPGTLF